MIKIQNWVTEAEVIAVLNQQPSSPHAYAGFVEAYWKGADAPASTTAEFCDILREWAAREGKIGAAFQRNYLETAPSFSPLAATPEHGWSLPDAISTKKSRSMGAALTSAHLRTLVDAWLATGRDPDGTERPSQRNLLKTRNGLDAVSEFIAECPPSMSPSLDRSGLVLRLAAPSWSRPWAADFFQVQEVTAKRLFVGIMASNWHEHLCKCRYQPCGRYFVGSKLRQSYKHGTFCSREHRARARAAAITKTRRHHAKRCLIEAAAQFLTKLGCRSDWSGDRKLKCGLAVLLSEQIRRDLNLRAGSEFVTLNWVTRNRAAIERSRRDALADTEAKGDRKQ